MALCPDETIKVLS